jgi:alpha-L-fucosidase 2
VVFFDGLLIPKPGYLIITTSKAPEQGGLVAGASIYHQIIREMFRNVAEAGQGLTIDTALSKHLLAKVEGIEPNRVGKYG